MSITFRVLRKNGVPFLLLPSQPKLAAKALDLYSAQTRSARIWKFALRTALATNFPLRLESERVEVSPDEPFARFLAELAGSSSLPPIGILAGNPRVPGQRFIVLIFDDNMRPVAVVKAGISETARTLVEKEKSFLTSVPESISGVPKVRASFDGGRVRAFALDFIEGRTPRRSEAIGLLLTSWLDCTRRLPLGKIPVFQRMASSFPITPSLQKAVASLAGCECHPALFHGDFAPWNIKVSRDGSWNVIDWERGELTGVPCWDWFHNTVQFAILVERLPVESIARKLESVLASNSFKAYAANAGVATFTRELLLAHLLHTCNVLRQTEGLDKVRALLAALTTQWLL